ncbi:MULTISPECIES: RbtT/DalT/CsbX family MFS transporter [unclassified Actinomyces]|uniref:RbtT/DalT/CsbX family MFS transporter n=1 Tax=unclassified Actinomyces TaxID=2609248 RepID=UPI00201786A5|nr:MULTISPECIES: RbtT/DalT/CsbX family MFS transporter [unclassified Actinomyces]MCL3778401.1 MFS transporter [Actinomyces sp. AC-20-1]MCL3790072.1 MFS transporter [Actinomyces sp. 187325]MCL3792327.1 MFS transporter [Actinomyces sp. 186855]MCL3794905.1 MFS transporter [Actinomyces sp. 217892]
MPSSNRLVAAIQRTGFPTNLAVGFLAVIIFVIGDGIEAVWITNYLSSDAVGFAVSQASMIVTSYGIVVAVAAFLSGALCDAIGCRRVMLIGLISFLTCDALFITVGLPSHNLPLLLLSYGLRGFGYPMFAYGFLTWTMMVTPPARQSSVSGWFWFAFSFGMQLIGSYLSSLLLPHIGHIATLWLGWALAAVGGTTGMLFLRRHPSSAQTRGKSVLESVGSAVSVLWRYPKVSVGGVVKVINLSGQYGMQAYYVVYLHRVFGMPESLAILEFSIFGFVAVLSDVFWGVVGDKIGWRNTLQWFATPITAAALVYIYLIPLIAGPSFLLIALGTSAVGIGLSAHVPTTPLITAHAHGETGNALAILNLGAGLGAFVGPAVVTLLMGDETTAEGYLWVAMALAGLYVISFLLCFALKLPGNARILDTSADAAGSREETVTA